MLQMQHYPAKVNESSQLAPSLARNSQQVGSWRAFTELCTREYVRARARARPFELAAVILIICFTRPAMFYYRRRAVIKRHAVRCALAVREEWPVIYGREKFLHASYVTRIFCSHLPRTVQRGIYSR